MHLAKFDFKRYFILILLLCLSSRLLIACDEKATPTSIPFNKITPGAVSSPKSGNTATNSTTNPAATTKLIGPTMGANGQITPNAPPADGKNISGRFFWIKNGNDMWGSGTGFGSPLNIKSLGGQRVVKVEDGALAKDPALSPDGSKLAYSYSPPPEKDPATGKIVIGADVYVLNLATKKTQVLVKRGEPEEFLEFPYWSADGQTLYFASRAPHRENGRITATDMAIGSFDLKKRQRQNLIKDGTEPVPMPDGKKLVYIGVRVSDETYAQSLEIYDLSTKQSKMLASDGQNFFGFRAPRPAPDGKMLVFGAIGGPDEIPIATPTPSGSLNTSSTLLGMLSSGIASGTGGASPGQPSNYEPNAHGLPWDLWAIKPDGSGLHRLTEIFEDEPIPAWSKDGQMLVFLAGNGFYTISANGDNLSKRSDEGAHGGFTWQP